MPAFQMVFLGADDLVFKNTIFLPFQTAANEKYLYMI